MKKLSYLLLLCLCLNACSVVAKKKKQMITHVVVVWLKPEVTSEQKNDLMQASLQLQSIAGIETLHIGSAIQSDRDIVDDSFSFALSMTFASRQAMQTYLADPRHVDFVNQHIQPNLKKIIVYDF